MLRTTMILSVLSSLGMAACDEPSGEEPQISSAAASTPQDRTAPRIDRLGDGITGVTDDGSVTPADT